MGNEEEFIAKWSVAKRLDVKEKDTLKESAVEPINKGCTAFYFLSLFPIHRKTDNRIISKGMRHRNGKVEGALI